MGEVLGYMLCRGRSQTDAGSADANQKKQGFGKAHGGHT